MSQLQSYLEDNFFVKVDCILEPIDGDENVIGISILHNPSNKKYNIIFKWFTLSWVYGYIFEDNNNILVSNIFYFEDKSGEKVNFYLLEKELNKLFNVNVNLFTPTLDLINLEYFSKLEFKEYSSKFLTTKSYNSKLEEFFSKHIYFLKDLLIKTKTFIIENKINNYTILIICSNRKKLNKTIKYLNTIGIGIENNKFIYGIYTICLVLSYEKLKILFSFGNIKYNGKTVRYIEDVFNKTSDIYNFDKKSVNIISLLTACKENTNSGYFINGFVSNLSDLW